MKKIFVLLALSLLVTAVEPKPIGKKIYFDFNSYLLSKDAKKYLDKIAPYLKKKLKNQKIMIAGHADNRGGRSVNFRISKKRACRVKKYLVSNYHIDPKRLICKAYGSSKPVANNSIEQGRALNRRVELLLIKAPIVLLHAIDIKYQYDKLGRVTKAIYSNGKVITFTYDAMGNIIQRVEN